MLTEMISILVVVKLDTLIMILNVKNVIINVKNVKLHMILVKLLALILPTEIFLVIVYVKMDGLTIQ